MLPPRPHVYLDANILIHVLDAHPQHVAHIEALVTMIEQQRIVLATSELTIAEVLVKPLSTGDMRTRHDFERMFNSPELSLLPVTRAILIHAAEIRGLLRIRLPDAIHVASAISFGATHFLTEDLGIRTTSDMRLVRLAELPNGDLGTPETSPP